MKSFEMIIDSRKIEYDVTYKQMKSMSMRVRGGRLCISAPYYMPQSVIEDNILRYKHKLLPQILEYSPYAIYRQDGYVDIFAQRYSICLRDVHQKVCQIHDQNIYVYHSDIQQCIELYLKKVLLDYIEEKIIGYLAYDFDLPMPTIEIKKYKGRWGSCYYQEQRVTFNLSLVHLEKDLIDYVIVHELTHFLQANHSPRFYQEIEKRMPQYKQRIKRLKEKHV